MISPQYIRDYLLNKLECNYKISSNNQELIIPSVFIENDHKKHMSVNMETGLWQCFKTGKTGNFVRLYSILEGITYRQAESSIMLTMISEGHEDIWNKAPIKNSTITTKSPLNTEGFLPINIHSYKSDNKLVVQAWSFLLSRNLLDLQRLEQEPFYLATKGRYKNRLIIPFKDPDGDIFFFQARSLDNNTQPKYLNPSTEEGVKSSNVLYPFNYDDTHLCVCEGPLDAISLQMQGINATCTVGSSISDVQMQMIREFEGKIILAYDNDLAGDRGVQKFDNIRKRLMMKTFYTVSPPNKYKDWNEAHIKMLDLHNWVMKETETYDYETITKRKLESL